MRQFLYLDTDMINSIIAQHDKGLLLQFSSETEKEKQKTRGRKGSSTASASLEVGLAKILRAQGNLALEGSLSREQQERSLVREIESKTLHDAAFDIAYKQLLEEFKAFSGKSQIGSFIEETKSFQLIDLPYLSSMFSSGGMIKYVKRQDASEVEQKLTAQYEALPRVERMSQKDLRKTIGTAQEESAKGYDEFHYILEALKSIIPYERLLMSADGLLAPLEDKYFRDNPKTMGFKFGGNITLFGYITNVIYANGPESEGLFSVIREAVNNVLRELLSAQAQDILVVHPIALYYG